MHFCLLPGTGHDESFEALRFFILCCDEAVTIWSGLGTKNTQLKHTQLSRGVSLSTAIPSTSRDDSQVRNM